MNSCSRVTHVVDSHGSVREFDPRYTAEFIAPFHGYNPNPPLRLGFDMLLEKKLFGLRLSPTEIAEVLERHLRDTDDPADYTEARAVLRRMRSSADNVYVRYALRPLDEPIDDRTAVRKALATLRTWRHLSGA